MSEEHHAEAGPEKKRQRRERHIWTTEERRALIRAYQLVAEDPRLQTENAKNLKTEGWTELSSDDFACSHRSVY